MEKIKIPSLILDEEKCRRNIRMMAEKARKSGVMFRPHFKTHQSHIIGRWFRETGVEKITVSSLSMADYFARDEWNDILVAFPVNVREIKTINQLAARVKLGILIADIDVLPALKENLIHKVDFYIKIDTGTHRTGFYPFNLSQIDSLISEAGANPNLVFKGFVAHAGHTYQTQSLHEVHKIYHDGVEMIVSLKERYIKKFPEIIASWGDTPTCSLIQDFTGLDEIRPGNFVFYDLMQFHLGSCDWDHIAMIVAAPVVARHTERSEVVLYAGAVHLSNDKLTLSSGESVFGEVVRFSGNEWKRFPKPVYIDRISQEHGIVSCPSEYLEHFVPGELVGIVPVHSCLAADLLKNYYDMDGELIK